MWATGYQDGLGGSIEDEMTVSGGSVVDVSDGRYGRVVTASADFGFNKANMACSVLGEEVIMTGDLDPSSSLEIVGSRIAGRQYEVSLEFQTIKSNTQSMKSLFSERFRMHRQLWDGP